MTTTVAEQATTTVAVSARGEYGFTFETERYETILVLSTWQDRASTSRVYVDGTEPSGLERPPYTNRGDDPANDRAWDRYNRAEIKAMREAAVPALAEFAHLVERAPGTLRFDRHAGCSCSCSPGFVADTMVRFAGSRIKQISIRVKATV